MSTTAQWIADEFGCLILPVGHAHVWIEKRPHYCDRGHFVAHVSGINDIDAYDAFPRYLMDVERAKAEMQAWLEWRLECRRRDGTGVNAPSGTASRSA